MSTMVASLKLSRNDFIKKWKAFNNVQSLYLGILKPVTEEEFVECFRALNISVTHIHANKSLTQIYVSCKTRNETWVLAEINLEKSSNIQGVVNYKTETEEEDREFEELLVYLMTASPCYSDAEVLCAK
eukprot:TRINITY_DN1323_c0_g1_i2.p1 TRINITY_DN1323_c0_g1~~TRINITY_DN1323_c0_g1_i2.p1  ORF type:complete len:129 (-),score=26.12 TRINITY_DN1323_c0_g1_i2:437-823(-)